VGQNLWRYPLRHLRLQLSQLIPLAVVVSLGVTACGGHPSSVPPSAEQATASITSATQTPESALKPAKATISPGDVAWFRSNLAALNRPFEDYSGSIGVEGNQYFVASREAAQSTAADLSAVLKVLPSMPSSTLRAKWTSVVGRFYRAASEASSAGSSASAKTMLDLNAAYGDLFNALADAANS
jgi:hypothetical protein